MGQNKFTAAPIDESIGLLNKINANALTEIKNKNPKFSSILELGVIGGEKEINNEELKLRVEVSKIVLEETLKQTKEKYLPLLRAKLKRLQTIEMYSQIIIAISSTTVVGLLSQASEEYNYMDAASIAAIFSLIGAILTIILKQNSGEWAMNNQNTAGSFNSLVNHRIKAEEILREMNVLAQFIDTNIEELKELVKQCNDINRDIRIIIDNYITK